MSQPGLLFPNVFSTRKQPLAPLELKFAFFYDGMLSIFHLEWRRVCHMGTIAAPFLAKVVFEFLISSYVLSKFSSIKVKQINNTGRTRVSRYRS